MSLSSKPISARIVKPLQHAAAAATEECGQSRVDFYQTFSMLIKMGNPERQGDLVNCRRQVINFFFIFKKLMWWFYTGVFEVVFEDLP